MGAKAAEQDASLGDYHVACDLPLMKKDLL